jgi:hypothetical protein
LIFNNEEIGNVETEATSHRTQGRTGAVLAGLWPALFAAKTAFFAGSRSFSSRTYCSLRNNVTPASVPGSLLALDSAGDRRLGATMKLSPNDVLAEVERVRTNSYRKFIKKVHLRNVRGFVDEVIEFKSQ